MNKTITLTVVGLGLAAAGAAGGYWFANAGKPHSMEAKPAAAATAPQNADRKPLYWHDPMYPQQKFDKPGKSPFMDMMLVPVYADDGA